MPLRVLTWNLFHGRSKPETPRSLLPEFTAMLAGWEWDVALLQEVLPWWPAELARAARASMRMALTSRNVLPPLQRPLAESRPGVLKSWAGGCNAILVRGQAIREHRIRRLRLLPERRVAHGVLLEDGTWVTNLHAQVHRDSSAQADSTAPRRRRRSGRRARRPCSAATSTSTALPPPSATPTSPARTSTTCSA